MPHDYPPWKTVYFHYMAWRAKKENGLSFLDEILSELVTFERQYVDGRRPKTIIVIPDSRSIKNADTSNEKG